MCRSLGAGPGSAPPNSLLLGVNLIRPTHSISSCFLSIWFGILYKMPHRVCISCTQFITPSTSKPSGCQNAVATVSMTLRVGSRPGYAARNTSRRSGRATCTRRSPAAKTCAAVTDVLLSSCDEPSTAGMDSKLAKVYAEVSYLAGRAKKVTEHFDAALGVDDFLHRLEIALFAFGFTGDNSIGEQLAAEGCSSRKELHIRAMWPCNAEATTQAAGLTNAAYLPCHAHSHGQPVPR